MKYYSMKIVDADDLFSKVKEKFPESKAEKIFCEGVENGSIRRFTAPAFEAEDVDEWRKEMYEVLHREIELMPEENVGIEFYW